MTMLTLEDGSSPVRNPSTAAEDARLASLVSLDGILKLVKVFYYFPSHFPLDRCFMNCASKSKGKTDLIK